MKIPSDVTDQILVRLWAKHAPIPYQWPHDERLDRWFADAIPAVFAVVRKHYEYVGNLRQMAMQLDAVEQERDALKRQVMELEYVRKAMGG